MSLTELQLDLLNQLDETPRRPMDLGGRDGSYHSAVLAALARKGFCERIVRSPGWRGSYLYRITPAGVEARATANRESEGEGSNE